MVGHSSTFYNVLPVQLLPPLARPTSTNSASVDLQNNDSAAFVVSVGAAGDTWSGTNRVELALQESSDNSAWTAVADSDMSVSWQVARPAGRSRYSTPTPRRVRSIARPIRAANATSAWL